MTKSAVASKRLAVEKRREHRMYATRPVRLDRGTGVTRNISISGVFFETDVDYAPGSVEPISKSFEQHCDRGELHEPQEV